MLLMYYMIAFILSFICWIFFISFETKKMNINLAMIFTIAAVSNGGYLALAYAKDTGTALLAQKIIYLIAIYSPMFVFFNIVALCKNNLSKIIRFIIVILCSGVYALTLTAGHSDIYYKSIELHQLDGITYITKEYGPTHILYTIVSYGVMILSFAIVAYAFAHPKLVSIKTSITLLVILLIIVTTFFGKMILDTNVQLMPMFYSVLVILLFILYRRADIYDIRYAILDSLEQEKYGYIVLDNKFNFIGCNDIAKVYYPPLDNIKIDYNIEDDKILFNQIRKKSELLESKEVISWNKKINHYSMKIELRYIKRNNKKFGYLMELIDDTKQQQYIKSINTYNNELKDTIDKQTQDKIEIQNKIILGMANVVESRDNSTGGHIKRTSEVVKIFSNKLKYANLNYKLDEEFFNNVIKAAPMHDLGKIAIDDSILRKPGRFTPEEYNEMKKHAEQGVVIINSVLEGVEDDDFVHIAKNMAHYHHEKYDGSGYPDGLSGEDIPLEARIMALADVFDALVSKRCYKEEFAYDEAFKIIEDSIGNHFDPELGKLFIECRSNLEYYYDHVESC